MIGCGRAALDLHLPAWSTVPEVKLVAVCDPSETALHAVAKRMPRIRTYTDVEKFLQESGPLGFVDVATPGHTHLELAEAVISHGVNLLCEKPLVLKSEDAASLVQSANEAGVLLACVHNYRFKPNAQRALRVFRSGVLGDIVSVSVRFRSGPLYSDAAAWRRREREHRTLLFDWAIHFVDLALVFLGPLRNLRFVDGDVDGVGLQRVVFGTLHENGSRGLFDLMVDASSTSTEIEVLGESAGMSLQFFPPGFRMLPRRDTPIHRGAAEVLRAFNFAGNVVGQRIRRTRCPEQARSHALLFRKFVAAIQGKKEAPVPNDEVLRTIALLDEVAQAVYEAKAH